MGKLLIILGLFLIILGIVLYIFPNFFYWFGNLPGDIKIKGDHSFIFIPLTSMIIISVIGTIILNLLNR